MYTEGKVINLKFQCLWQLIACLIIFELYCPVNGNASVVGISSGITANNYSIIKSNVKRRSADECSRAIPINHVCEHKTFDLRCNSGEVISVTSALYGRLDRSTCPSSEIYHTNCRASNSLNIVQSRCNGKRTCSVPATNSVFGDPCVTTFKYLEIQYSCVKECCPACENGGTCTDVNVCQCRAGFEGEKCETPICTPACRNGGRCIDPDVCECPNGFTGDICQFLLELCPEDIVKSAQMGRNGTVVSWNTPNATSTNVTMTHRNGHFFNIGSTAVYYHIENVRISASCSFKVEVIDYEPPEITCPDDYEGFTEINSTSAIASWPPITASDNSGITTSIICNGTNGSTFLVGVTEVNCVAYDPSGNNNTCSFLVHIKARCPPISTKTDIGLLSWPETVAGTTIESTERCPVNSERRNFGLATRECASNPMYGGVWRGVMPNPCGETDEPELEDLASTTVTEDNVEEVAETLAAVTESSSNAESGVIDINAVQETLTNIVNVESPSVEVTEAVVEVVDNILSVNTSMEETRASQMSSSMILKSFEQQISQTLTKKDSFTIRQPNVVVEAVTLNQTQARNGLSFEVNHNMGTYNDTMYGYEEKLGILNSTSSIVLPSEVLFNSKLGNETKVSFVSYNEDHLFRSRMLSTQNTSMVVLGPIISAVILGYNITNSSTPIVIQTSPAKANTVNLNSSRCVFWDFTLNDGIGDWAPDGCQLVDIGADGATCHCNHLTNFAVLVDYVGQSHEPTDFDFALDIISMIGCTLSIAGLSLTLLVFLSQRRLRQTLPRKILIQFCASMLCLYLVFLVGIDTKLPIGCMVIAALLHYFVLATLFWMAVEARHMYISLVSVFDMAGSHFMLKAACFAWGLPLIPVGVALGIYQKNYSTDTYCFLAPGYGLYFGLLLPVGLVIFNNSTIFLLIIRRLLKSNLGGNVNDKSNRKKILQRLKNAFTISILLGLTWVFGFLAIGGARKVFQVLFCVANSFQGVLLFIQFCLNQDDVRKALKNLCFTEDLSKEKSKKLSAKKNHKFVSASDVSRASQILPSMSFSTETGMLQSKSEDLHQTENIYNEIATTDNTYEMI